MIETARPIETTRCATASGWARRFLLATAVAGFACAVAAGTRETAPAASRIMPLAPRSLITDVVAYGDETLAVGERGHILTGSPESGWRQHPAPTRQMLTAVAVTRRGAAWAVGHDSLILHSIDGLEWSIRHYAPEWEAPLFDIWFEDDRLGLAIGAYGLILRTEDSGQTWTESRIDPDEPHLYGIIKSRRGRFYVAGEFGGLFRSEDFGVTWRRLDSPYDGSLFGIIEAADGGLLTFGLQGNLFRSEDFGVTWRPVETPTAASLTAATMAPDGRLFIVGLSGAIYVSDDDGRTVRDASLRDRYALSSAIALDRNRLLLAGDAGLITHNVPPGGGS